MIFTILLLLPVIALAICAYEDYKTRKCSNLSLLALALSYIPFILYTIAAGMYAHPIFWILAAPSIVVWFILLIYGMITGRGGADRIVILLGALSPCGFMATLMGLICSAIVSIYKKRRDTKFPFIVPYFVFYVFCYVMLL